MWQIMCYVYTLMDVVLTHKQLKMHGCMLSTEATDALVLKHQGISTHSADQISIALHQFQTKISHL